MSGIFSFLRSKPKDTARGAADRLQILVAHERKQDKQPEWMPQLQREILELISKYVDISIKDIDMDIREEQDKNLSVLELNVTLPEEK